MQNVQLLGLSDAASDCILACNECGGQPCSGQDKTACLVPCTECGGQPCASVPTPMQAPQSFFQTPAGMLTIAGGAVVVTGLYLWAKSASPAHGTGMHGTRRRRRR